MPNLDETGPEGKGLKTGRGLGKCDDQDKANLSDDRGMRPRRFKFNRLGRGGLNRRSQSGRRIRNN